MEDREDWTTISSDAHFADDHLSVVTERVRTPHRTDGHAWTIVRRKSAVVVAAMTAEGNFVLIQQERIPIRTAIWEMPAGQVDQLCGCGSFRDVALRELREETGYELAPKGETVFLGDFFFFTRVHRRTRVLVPRPAGAARYSRPYLCRCRNDFGMSRVF